jgi:hypothetical protein
VGKVSHRRISPVLHPLGGNINNSVPLFTSLPPRLRGETIDPAAPASLQTALVETWHAAGYSPVSMNTVGEHQRHPGLRSAIEALGVKSVTFNQAVPPGAGRSRGRHDHLCTLTEYLGVIHDYSPSGPVAIVNADIGLQVGARANDIAEHTPAEFFMGQRLDVVQPPRPGDGPCGVMDIHGVDFLAFASEVIPSLCRLVPENLRLALPWWDHYLPLALLALGGRPRLIRPGALWHVVHGDRWCMDTYVSLGLTAARQFQDSLGTLPESVASRTWLRLFDDRFNPSAAWNGTDRLVRHAIKASLAPSFLIRNRLAGLGAGNIAILLQAAATES